jgi:formamidopyrimidine-DNA glycosylase
MPELPEVETICRWLRQGKGDQPPLPGSRVRSAVVLWERTIAEPSALEFCTRLEGQEVQTVGRRGKFLILSLSRDSLIFHLRMSGDLRVEPCGTPLGKHDRLAIEFSNGQRLVFNDTRKFGRAWLVNDPQTVFHSLGPEPLSADFTPDWLFGELQTRRRQMKPLLLDQTFLAGMGNIYTDEALHMAKISPFQTADTLSHTQVESLHTAIRSVLQTGIRNNGASIDWVYRGGDFQNHFRVYQRTGKPCPECGTPVERSVLFQRSTHYCPSCQSGSIQKE